jgi:protein-S-isoprenylcysteine O-methyltransferase Ste14
MALPGEEEFIMAETRTDAGARPGGEGASAGKIIVYLLLGLLGTVALWWARTGYGVFLEQVLPARLLSLLPLLLIPLWALCLLAVGLELRRARAPAQAPPQAKPEGPPAKA